MALSQDDGKKDRVIDQHRATIERLERELRKYEQPVVYQACEKHKGQSWSVIATTSSSTRFPTSMCPLCESAALAP